MATMRAKYEAPAGGLVMTLERAELTTAFGSGAVVLSVWFKGRAEPFTAAMTDAEARRVLAALGDRARAEQGDLRIGD
jgi:hypothetical protein